MSNLLLYAITVLVWGSTWLAIEFQLGEVAPEVSVVYRYCIAAALLFAWCLLTRKPLRFGLRAHGTFALMGLTLFGLNYIATYSAQQYITSALNAIAFSSLVWMNILNARLFLGTRFEPRALTGAGLGMLGVVVLFWPEVNALTWNDTTMLGAALCLGGAYVASLGNIVSQSAQKHALPVVQSNAWGMFYGTLITGAIALLSGRSFVFEFTVGYVGSLLFLAVFGSIVAFGTYLTLLGRIGAPRAGYAVVMFPVVALLLSYLFEGLALDGHIIAGVALVLTGNVVILGNALRRQRSVGPARRLATGRAAQRP